MENPPRHDGLTGQLLSEAEDEKLQKIVQEAAKDLGTPIALVTLVLDHIQFFKAHYGLPEDLAKARGTGKDVSFCQFVVKENQTFEVSNADTRDDIPKALVESHGIKSYLGVPIYSNNEVVGSICVLDTQPRAFTDQNRTALQELSNQVNKRFEEINANKNLRKTQLYDKSGRSAISQLRANLKSMKSIEKTGHLISKEIGLFLRISEMAAYGRITDPEVIRDSIRRAKEILERFQNTLYDQDATLADTEDALNAMAQIFEERGPSSLSEIALSGRELARSITDQSGGVYLPELEKDYHVATSMPVGVALVSNTLMMIAQELLTLNFNHRINMVINKTESDVEIQFRTAYLSHDTLMEIASSIQQQIGIDPTVLVRSEEDHVSICLALINES